MCWTSKTKLTCIIILAAQILSFYFIFWKGYIRFYSGLHLRPRMKLYKNESRYLLVNAYNWSSQLSNEKQLFENESRNLFAFIYKGNRSHVSETQPDSSLVAFTSNRSRSHFDKKQVNSIENVLVNADSGRRGLVTTKNILKYPIRNVKQVDCRKIIEGDKDEIKKSHEFEILKQDSETSESIYLEKAKDCEKFRIERGYITSPLTKREQKFPLAFSILIYKDVEQAERLLRAIYRPQNYYCIHVDKKSTRGTLEAITAIASCFPNVFIASKLINVIWGTFTVLEPELVCMEDLWQRKEWKYFINLTGQEFPIRTNYELVRILSRYDGASSVASSRLMPSRWKGAGPVPHNLQLKKGAVHVTLSRDFVDFALHNPVAVDLLNWTKRTKHPDETFFNTLAHNEQLGISGSQSGGEVHLRRNRYKNWQGDNKLPCAGKFVRGICIIGAGDLQLVTKSSALFVNKFHLDYQPLALDCMEEWHMNRTWEDYRTS